MRCREVRNRLLEYLYGSLEKSEKIQVESHLAACERCRREWLMWQKLEKALQEEPLLPPGPDFTQRVLAATITPVCTSKWARVALWVLIAFVAAGWGYGAFILSKHLLSAYEKISALSGEMASLLGHQITQFFSVLFPGSFPVSLQTFFPYLWIAWVWIICGLILFLVFYRYGEDLSL